MNAFIQEEDDESYIYNVRTSVNDLLGVRASAMPECSQANPGNPHS